MSFIEKFAERCIENRWWDQLAVRRGMHPTEYATWHKSITPEKWKVVEQYIYWAMCIRQDRFEFLRTNYKPDFANAEMWNRFFKHQNVIKDSFIKMIRTWLTQEYGRINCLRLVGRPGTGKSLFAQTLSKALLHGKLKVHTTGSGNFYFESCTNKALILWEECMVDVQTAQDVKKLFAGDSLMSDIKYGSPAVVTRTPVIITSNSMSFGRGFLPSVDEVALEDRCYTLHFNNVFISEGLMTVDGLMTWIFQ